MIPAFGRQGQVDFFAFKACLVYIESSRTAGVIYRDPLLKTKNNKKINCIDTSYSYKSLFSFFRFVSTFYSWFACEDTREV